MYITMFTIALKQVPVLIQMNGVHTRTYYLCEIHFSIILTSEYDDGGGGGADDCESHVRT
jgi:hypothetical protein